MTPDELDIEAVMDRAAATLARCGYVLVEPGELADLRQDARRWREHVAACGEGVEP